MFFCWVMRCCLKFEKAYAVEEQAERKVLYADRAELETEVFKKFPQAAEPIEFDDGEVTSKKCTPKTRKRTANQKK